MLNIINSQIYRIIVPKYFRRKILFKVLRASVLEYYASLPQPHSDEIEKVLNFLRSESFDSIPHELIHKYKVEDVLVHNDKVKGLKYVMHNNKRLYFKRIWDNKRIQRSYTGLAKEQDPQSPHCYTNHLFKVDEGDVIVDVGAAEGIFALDAVEKASKLILFEANNDWIEALNATFEPWKEKVTIVNKFVGNVNSSTQITLDEFIAHGEKISFLKVDIEGAEQRLIEGCKRILQHIKPLNVAICTYHKHNDEVEFKDILTSYGFETSYSDGYMLYYFDKKIKAPYLRRGVLRATKLL